MTRKATVVFASLVLLAGALDFALIHREYRRGTSGTGFSYTRFVAQRDTADAASNAFEALEGAELHEEDYVLTGETQYLEAFHKELQAWSDEDGTLQLVAGSGDGSGFIREFSGAGKQTVNELNLVAAIYENTGQNAAIERLRKGGAIFYLDQARSAILNLRQLDFGGGVVRAFTEHSIGSSARMAVGAGALLVLLAVASALAVFQTRQPG